MRRPKPTNGQPELFDWDRQAISEPTPVKHLHRRDAPDTSVEAAENLPVTKLECYVLRAIEELCKSQPGCISDEVQHFCSSVLGIHNYSSVTARFAALERKKLIEYTGEKRPGISKRKQRIMRITDAGTRAANGR